MRETRVGKIPWRRERLPTPVFGLENSMDSEKSQTGLSDFHYKGLTPAPFILGVVRVKIRGGNVPLAPPSFYLKVLTTS